MGIKELFLWQLQQTISPGIVEVQAFMGLGPIPKENPYLGISTDGIDQSYNPNTVITTGSVTIDAQELSSATLRRVRIEDYGDGMYIIEEATDGSKTAEMCPSGIPVTICLDDGGFFIEARHKPN